MSVILGTYQLQRAEISNFPLWHYFRYTEIGTAV